MIAATVALILLTASTPGAIPLGEPLPPAIAQPAPRIFDPGAEKEMAVVRWYMNKRDTIGAISRLKVILQQHRDSTRVEEALERLVEAYMELGIVNEAQSAAATLGRHFPNSPWYVDALRLLQSAGVEPREDPNSWITRSFD